jgi:hypothetical protein
MALTGMDDICRQSISAWRKKNVKEFAEYQYFFDGLINPLAFLPQVSPEWLLAKMKWNIKNGINNGGGKFPALSWPLVYANARFAGNPEIPAYEPVKEFCNFIYGKAAEPMFEFYKKLYSKTEKVWLNRGKIFADTYPAQMAFTSTWSVADITELDNLITQAEKLADSERSRNFLRKTRLEFNGMKYLLLAFYAKKQFEAAKNIENLRKVKKYVDAFENWRDAIFKLYVTDKTFIKNYWPNYERLCIILMSKGHSWGPQYAKLRAQLPAAAKGEISFHGCAVGSHLAHAEINEPLTWNFAKMFKQLAATGDTREVLRVSRIKSPPVKQGKINLAAWSKLPVIELAPFKLEKNASQDAGTKVKLAWDDKKLYVLFECAESRINKLRLYSGARDGRIYVFDSVELFLNPKCESKKTFQFVVSPAEGAVFEAKRDYEVSAADPGKLPVDFSWNPDFSYLYTIDKASGKYYVQFAIPFSSLGEKAPDAGKVWWANFCRNRIIDLPKPELSSWSTETFGHNPALFNKLVFEQKEN